MAGNTTSWRETPVIYSIILCCAMVYFWILIYAPGSAGSTCYAGLQTYRIIEMGEYWRILSSIFVHYGIIHFSLNMVALLIFGSYAEKSFGHLWSAVIYLFCGIFANVVALSISYYMGDANYCAIGASGAILGLASATAYLMWKVWRIERDSAALGFATQLVIILLIQFTLDMFVPNVSRVHHFAGALGGILVAGWIIRQIQNSNRV